MDPSARPSVPVTHRDDQPEHVDAADRRLSSLASLLENLDESVRADAAPRDAYHQNQLIQARLGIASSLYHALRSKHAPTAAHCLRVALGCSSWSLAMDLTDEQRDEIEIAALLHDIGKIGVPDHLLQKSGNLSHDEMCSVERQRQSGLQILESGCGSREILDIARYTSAWYDGTKDGFDRCGEQLPLGARMIAIVDGFDAMTTDHVYRHAMSRDRAMAEMFEGAGTQFDPRLVREFCTLLAGDSVKLSAAVARRWLRDLHSRTSNSLWSLEQPAPTIVAATTESLFHQKLLETMHDGVVFVDPSLKILHWNRAGERLTGIPSSSVYQKNWSPSLIEMRDEHLDIIRDHECPVAHAILTGVQTIRRLSISSRGKKRLAVDALTVPVIGRDGVPHGAMLLLHDASSEITLEERVQSLHEKAIRDPLTQLANRAEFDRVHNLFVETHLERGLPCSLIICDLDHFKSINDNYGHQAGDEALVNFASLLKRHCRSGDLVARYGGEEFVMVCADCDNATATERAEKIRAELAAMPQSMLGNQCVTASFGVTEVQGGDTPETMLRRADRGLLQAKDMGRNTVVQLGCGINGEEKTPNPRGWFSWFHSTPPDQVLERRLITAVPLKIAAEKLRGFVADHEAEITAIDENHVALKIEGNHTPLLRRSSDRPVPFLIELRFEETRLPPDGRKAAELLRTMIHVVIRPRRSRDRRRHNCVERARQLLVSLKSYLMAQEYSGIVGDDAASDQKGGVVDKARHVLAPLFVKKT